MEAVLLIVPRETKGIGNLQELSQTRVLFVHILNSELGFGFRILVWEDGYCDFYECERAARGNTKGRFGADVFFKMSHEVYSFGEG